MKRKIICVACLMLIGLLAGCKKNAEEEKNVESSKEVQLDSTNMPLEISANVEKRLNGQRIKVKVIEECRDGIMQYNFIESVSKTVAKNFMLKRKDTK